MPSKKRLIINMLANALAFTVQFGINFFLTPYIVSTLGSEAYGFIPLVNNIIGYASIITVALDSISARFITIEITRGNYQKANSYFNSVLLADTILALLLMMPSLLFILKINDIINVPVDLLVDVQLTFFFAFLTFFVNLIFAVIGCCYYVKNRVDLNAKRSIESNIIRACILIALFTLNKPHIFFVTITTAVVAMYLFACNVHYSRKLTPELRVDLHKFSFLVIKEMLSTGVWNSINALSSTLLTGLDLLLANIFLGASQSGEYALVKTVPNFICQLVIVVLSAFVPEFNILYAKGDKKELLKSVDFSLRIMGYLVTIPIGFLIVFGKEFFSAWVPGQNVDLLQQLSIMTLLPLIAICGTDSITKIYTVTNKLRTPAIFMIIMGILNATGDYLLFTFTSLGIWVIPCVSFIVNIIIQLLFTPIFGAYCLHLKWNTFYLSIARSCSCAIVVISVSLLFKFIIQPQGWFSLFLTGFLCSILSLIFSFFIAFDKDVRVRIVAILKSKLQKQ